MDGTEIDLKVLPSDPVVVLAVLMRTEIDMNGDTFNIFFEGEQLDFTSLVSLKSLGMKDGSNIYLVLFK